MPDQPIDRHSAGNVTTPRILVAGTYHPTCSVEHVEHAFRAFADVTYLGTPWGLQRTGHARDVDMTGAQADLLFFVEEWFPFFPRGLEKASFPTAAFFVDVSYDLPRRLAMAPFFDHVFLAHKDYVDTFRAIHPSVHWLPVAAPRDLFRPGTSPRDLDVAFVGTLARERVPLLQRLEREFRMNDFRREYDLPELADTYRRAKIVVNKGREGEITLRIFEATAAGALLVTQEGAPGLDDLFVPGRDIVTYRDDDDAVRVIRDLLRDEEARHTIAEAGHRAFLARHTWEHRARTVLDVVTQANGQPFAPARGWSEAERLVKTAAVFAHFPMIDELFTIIAESRAHRWAKVRAMRHLARAVAKGVRHLGWRRFLTGRGPST